MPHKFYSGRSKLKYAPVYFVLIAIGASLPFLVSGAAAYLAQANGCEVNEAGVHPCIIGQFDFGELFSVMFSFGWMMLITIPAGLFVFFVFLYYTISDFKYYRKNKDSDYNAWLKKIKTDHK